MDGGERLIDSPTQCSQGKNLKVDMVLCFVFANYLYRLVKVSRILIVVLTEECSRGFKRLSNFVCKAVKVAGDYGRDLLLETTAVR